MARPSWAPIQLPLHRRSLTLLDFCRMLDGDNSSHPGIFLSESGSACPCGLVGRVSEGSLSPALPPFPWASSQGCLWPVLASQGLSPTWRPIPGASWDHCPLSISLASQSPVLDLFFSALLASSPGPCQSFGIFGYRFPPPHPIPGLVLHR